MDPTVDQSTGAVATETTEAERTGPTGDSEGVGDQVEDGDQTDIESELYCSTREMGMSAVGFGPFGDS